MENENEVLDSQNETETTETNDQVVNLDEQEDAETLKKQIATLKAQKEHWKTKAEKADQKSEQKADDKPEPLQELSAKDSLLLAKADVDIEDVDEVVDFARFRKVSIAEALKNTTLKAILADKKEQRQTAMATITKTNRSAAPVSGDALLEKARRGEGKEEDIEKVVQARMESKLNK